MNVKLTSKLIIRALSIMIFIIYLINIQISSPRNANAAAPGGSYINCYCTFRIGGGGCIYTVTDCGACTAIECYEYFDSGRCRADNIVKPD
jgi:hypothetical protein